MDESPDSGNLKCVRIMKILITPKVLFFSLLKTYKRAKKIFSLYSQKNEILDFDHSGHVDLTFASRFALHFAQNGNDTLNHISRKTKNKVHANFLYVFLKH